MSAFPGVSSYQSSSPGSKFVVIGVVCCQEMRCFTRFCRFLQNILENYITFSTSSLIRFKLKLCRNDHTRNMLSGWERTRPIYRFRPFRILSEQRRNRASYRRQPREPCWLTADSGSFFRTHCDVQAVFAPHFVLCAVTGHNSRAAQIEIAQPPGAPGKSGYRSFPIHQYPCRWEQLPPPA